MFLTLLVKGFIIGFSFTIPGCSGGSSIRSVPRASSPATR
mgnify:CR=1 FL=1